MKIMNVTEVLGEGLESLLGEKVILFCSNYFYSGILKGVNSDCVLLENPSIIYDTGEWSLKNWKDSQRLHCDKLYVNKNHIESFSLSK